MIINLCGQWTANCRAEGQHCSAVSTPRPSDTGDNIIIIIIIIINIRLFRDDNGLGARNFRKSSINPCGKRRGRKSTANK